MGADIASSQQVADVLRANMRSREADSSASTIAITVPPVLCDAGTEHIRQVLKASTTGQNYAADDGRVSDWVFTLFSWKEVSATLLNGDTFLAERFDELGSSRKKRSFTVRSGSYGSVAFLSRYFMREKLHA